MSTKQKTTIYVKLKNEAVEVWRPVEATQIGDGIYQLRVDQPIPEDEEWEFTPGDTVEVSIREFEAMPRRIASRKIR